MRTVDLRHCGSGRLRHFNDKGPRLAAIAIGAVLPVDGYEYSSALRATGGGAWDRARFDRFLANPQVFAPGMSMDVGGVRDAAERAEVLDLLELLARQKPTVATAE